MVNEKKVRWLMTQSEGQFVEFKTSISRDISKEMVAFANSGGLPPGMSPQEFGRKTVRRNKLLAELFHRTGEVEKVGSGIGRMRAMMTDMGLEQPRLEFTSFFTVTFRRVRKSTPQVGTKSAPSRHQVKILELCVKAASFTELMVHFDRKDRTKFRRAYIRPLLDDGMIVMTIPNKPRSRKQKYITTDKGKKVLRGDDNDV